MAVSQPPQGHGQRRALPCDSFSSGTESAEGMAENLGFAVSPYGPGIWETPPVVPTHTPISSPKGKIYWKETQRGG